MEASNQERQRVASYEYTCIFEYAKGQRETPETPDSASPAPGGPAHQAAARPASPRLLDYSTAAEGLQMAQLSITESQEIMNRKNGFRLAGRANESNIHTDEEFARQNIFGGTVNSGPATMSYVDQMLQLSFPAEAFYNGGRLLMRAINPLPQRRPRSRSKEKSTADGRKAAWASLSAASAASTSAASWCAWPMPRWYFLVDTRNSNSWIVPYGRIGRRSVRP